MTNTMKDNLFVSKCSVYNAFTRPSVKYFTKNEEWNLKEIGVYLYPFFNSCMFRFLHILRNTKSLTNNKFFYTRAGVTQILASINLIRGK